MINSDDPMNSPQTITMFLEASVSDSVDLSFDSSTGSHPLHDTSDANDVVDKALVALNIAASLIKKDRVDARRLGMESLVLLTDPLRAGIETAKIASRVVLLGSAREDLNGGLDGEDDVDALFDESAGLGIRETILEMIMEDDRGGKYSAEDEEIEREFHEETSSERPLAVYCIVLCCVVYGKVKNAMDETRNAMELR